MPRFFKPAVAVALLIYMGVQVLSFRVHEKQRLSAVEKVVVYLAAPLQRVLWRLVEGAGDSWNHYVALTETAKRNDRLEREAEELKARLSGARELENENVRLREVLDLGAREKLRLLAAERIASGASPFERTLRIRRGAADGVKREMAVIHPLGAVGQVIQVFEHASDVLLLIDLNSAADAMSQRSRARGVIRGAGMDELRLDFLARSDDVQPGDEIVTTGLDGIFPEGIPVGAVTKVFKDSKGLFFAAAVRPHVRFSRVGEVAVVVKGER